MINRILILVVTLGCTGAVNGEDRLDMEGIKIIGNSELPRALYIVPWKEADQRTSAGKPVDSLTGQALEPLEREGFLRRLKYYDGGGVE